MTLVTYLIVVRPKKWRKKRLSVIVASSLTVVIGIQICVDVMFRHERFPALLWIMLLPFISSCIICIVIWTEKGKVKNRLIGSAVIILGLLFSMVLFNNYYRYCPTLFDAFGIHSPSRITLSSLRAAFHHKSLATTKPISTLTGAATQGKVYSLDIPGTISHFKARTGWVYVPAVAFTSANINLPVIVLLSGVPGSTDDWINGGDLVQTMNAYAATHHGITPLVVMVDHNGSELNDTECVDSPRGNVETYLTQDVPNFIKGYFNVSTNPQNWAIGGLSDGGTCGVMLALRHPNIYRYFLDFSGEIGPEVGTEQQTIDALFHGSFADWQDHQPLYLMEHTVYTNTGGYFAVGSNDNPAIVNQVRELYTTSRYYGLNTQYETIPGEHTFAVWAQAYKDALPWIAERISTTP